MSRMDIDELQLVILRLQDSETMALGATVQELRLATAQIEAVKAKLRAAGVSDDALKAIIAS